MQVLARITSPPLAEASTVLLKRCCRRMTFACAVAPHSIAPHSVLEAPLAKILEATSGAAAAKAMGFAKEANRLDELRSLGRAFTLLPDVEALFGDSPPPALEAQACVVHACGIRA